MTKENLLDLYDEASQWVLETCYLEGDNEQKEDAVIHLFRLRECLRKQGLLPR